MTMPAIPSGLKDYEALTALQLNAYRFSGRQTPLTPAMLEADSQNAANPANDKAQSARQPEATKA